MSNTIKLLNKTEFTFTRYGIIVESGDRVENFEFKSPKEGLFISLILLSANEKNLSRALNAYKFFKKVPGIKETIIVGNRMQNKNVLLNHKNIKFIRAKKPKSPIITSVKCALSCISNFSQYALVFPVSKEIPSLDKLSKFINRVIKNKFGFAVPVINKKRFHPIMIRNTEFPKIRKIRKEQGLKYFSKILFNEVEL